MPQTGSIFNPLSAMAPTAFYRSIADNQTRDTSGYITATLLNIRSAPPAAPAQNAKNGIARALASFFVNQS
jgi:hypothetical protein